MSQHRTTASSLPANDREENTVEVSNDELFWNEQRLMSLLARVHSNPGRPQPPLQVELSSPTLHVPATPPQSRVPRPSFGGVERDDSPEVARTPRRQGNSADLSVRLQAKALLYTNPTTPCTTAEIANIFRLREATVRAARPASAMKCGRAWLAPFGDWLRSLQHAGQVPTWGEREERQQATSPAPRQARGSKKTSHLQPLGGPGRS